VVAKGGAEREEEEEVAIVVMVLLTAVVVVVVVLLLVVMERERERGGGRRKDNEREEKETRLSPSEGYVTSACAPVGRLSVAGTTYLTHCLPKPWRGTARDQVASSSTSSSSSTCERTRAVPLDIGHMRHVHRSFL